MRLTQEEKNVLLVAASRLHEMADVNDPEVYDYGTMNRIRELKRIANES